MAKIQCYRPALLLPAAQGEGLPKLAADLGKWRWSKCAHMLAANLCRSGFGNGSAYIRYMPFTNKKTAQLFYITLLNTLRLEEIFPDSSWINKILREWFPSAPTVTEALQTHGIEATLGRRQYRRNVEPARMS